MFDPQNSYQELEQLIEDGKLEIISIFSIPRTGSTVVTNALCNAKVNDGARIIMYNEPANFGSGETTLYNEKRDEKQVSKRNPAVVYHQIAMCYRIEKLKDIIEKIKENNIPIKRKIKRLNKLEDLFRSSLPNTKRKLKRRNKKLISIEGRLTKWINKLPDVVLRQIDSVKRQKIIMLLKDHTTFFVEDEFRKRFAISSHVVFTVRDPVACCMSMLCRYLVSFLTKTGKMQNKQARSLIADCLVEPNGLSEEQLARFLQEDPITGDRLAPKRVLKLAGQRKGKQSITPQHVKDASEVVVDFCKRWFDVGWKNLEMYSKLSDELNSKSVSVVSYDELLSSPEGCVRWLAKRINNFDYSQTMMTGWQNRAGYSGAEQSFREKDLHTWFDHINNSTGIKVDKDGICDVDINEFPHALHDVIKDANDIYKDILDQNYCFKVKAENKCEEIC